MNRTQELYKEGIKLIPGATPLFSKRPEQWPNYYAKSKKCRVWDLDSMVRYVRTSARSLSDLRLTARFLPFFPATALPKCSRSPATLRFCRLVSEKNHQKSPRSLKVRQTPRIMTIAVRIARAAAKKDTTLFCGWHNTVDGMIFGLEPAVFAKGMSNGYPMAAEQANLKVHISSIETDTIDSALGGPVCHSGFQRLA